MNEENNNAKYDVYDDPDYKQAPDEPVYFDNSEYKNFTKSKKSGGKTLSVLSFICGIASMFYMFGGFLLLAAGFAAVGIVFGAIALARKNLAAGLALAGTIISLLMLIMNLYGYVTESLFFKRRGDDNSHSSGYNVQLPDGEDDMTIDI